jgi:ATP-dependent Clp protease protease subunit
LSGPPADWLRGRLLERRIVLLRGRLDDEMATVVTAELMALAASGADPIDLQVDSEGGPIRPALSLVDTIGVLGVDVHATCLGRAEGSAVGVFSAGTRRLMAPHARLHLCEPPTHEHGDAASLRQLAANAAADLAALVSVVASACHRPPEHVEAEMAAGCWLDAESAVAYGLADGVRR